MIEDKKIKKETEKIPRDLNNWIKTFDESMLNNDNKNDKNSINELFLNEINKGELKNKINFFYNDFLPNMEEMIGQPSDRRYYNYENFFKKEEIPNIKDINHDTVNKSSKKEKRKNSKSSIEDSECQKIKKKKKKKHFKKPILLESNKDNNNSLFIESINKEKCLVNTENVIEYSGRNRKEAEKSSSLNNDALNKTNETEFTNNYHSIYFEKNNIPISKSKRIYNNFNNISQNDSAPYIISEGNMKSNRKTSNNGYKNKILVCNKNNMYQNNYNNSDIKVNDNNSDIKVNDNKFYKVNTKNLNNNFKKFINLYPPKIRSKHFLEIESLEESPSDENIEYGCLDRITPSKIVNSFSSYNNSNINYNLSDILTVSSGKKDDNYDSKI